MDNYTVTYCDPPLPSDFRPRGHFILVRVPFERDHYKVARAIQLFTYQILKSLRAHDLDFSL